MVPVLLNYGFWLRRIAISEQQFEKFQLDSIRHIVAVASGKGGVGKSTVSVNLAVALAARGATVGLLDADIYGPSQGPLLGLPADTRPDVRDDLLLPIEAHGVRCMSMSFVTSERTPAIWRGPMASGAMQQLLTQTDWGELDYLIVDMPPGTGDTQLTFSQEIKMDGAIIVSTPQEVALLDVKRGIKMFDKLGVKILGLVDNMSYFIGDDGKKYKIFGEGGVKKTAVEFDKEFLGEIPINPLVGETSDNGKPIVESNPDHEISKIYIEFAKKIKSTYL